MMLKLAESGKYSQDLATQVEIAAEDILTRQYIRFCQTDAWQPNINVYETTEAIVVCVDLAGMSADSIQVEVQDNYLTLRGERPRPLPSTHNNSIGVHLMEINAGAFYRRVEIPSPVNHDEVTASYREGLLWITLPKKT